MTIVTASPSTAVTLQGPSNSTGPGTLAEPTLAQPAQPAMEEIPQSPGAATAPTAPIDLATALELAAGQNPQVLFAQQRIREAAAQLQQADALWLPSLRAGVNYNKHEGRLQDVEGVVERRQPRVAVWRLGRPGGRRRFAGRAGADRQFSRPRRGLSTTHRRANTWPRGGRRARP